MTNANVFQLCQPGTFADPLTEILRNGARALLAQAVEAEVAVLLASHADKLTDDGRQRLVRHGHLPEREIMTGIGPVAVRCPRVRDRASEGSERIRFSSAILPPYARRRIEALRAIGGGGGTPEMRKMRGVTLQKAPRKNIEISNYVTSPPSETAPDLADFHQRQGHAPRFAGKGREIALGRCRMGRCEGPSAGRLRASSQGAEGWILPPGRGER